MNIYIIPASLIVTSIIIFVLSLFSKRRVRSLGVVFILIFLATWSGQLWISPAGPNTMGVAWIPLLVIALIFLFLLLTVIPAVPKIKRDGEVEEGPLIAIGIFFWIMIVLLIFSIAIGYYRTFNHEMHQALHTKDTKYYPELVEGSLVHFVNKLRDLRG